MGQHYLGFTICWTFYATLNYLELPFFEQYKAFDDPWPWKADFEKWLKLFFESMKLVSFNNGVLIPIIAFMYYMQGQELPFDFSPQGVPTPIKFAI